MILGLSLNYGFRWIMRRLSPKADMPVEEKILRGRLRRER
jgi:hypothetical protein